MSQGAIFLHFGHVASADAAFFLATLIYLPVGVIALVAAMDISAKKGVGRARRFMARYDRVGTLVKASAFLLVLSSGIGLGYVPSHVNAEPVAAALFSLDAAVLIGSSLLVVTLPALRPAALILMVAGIVAYMLGGVQLDATGLFAQGRRSDRSGAPPRCDRSRRKAAGAGGADLDVTGRRRCAATGWRPRRAPGAAGPQGRKAVPEAHRRPLIDRRAPMTGHVANPTGRLVHLINRLPMLSEPGGELLSRCRLARGRRQQRGPTS